MKTLVAEAMQQGALGVSTALQYVPGRFASTDELVALASVASQYGGIYITHQRSEAAQIDSSLDEILDIARRARIPAEIWHLKTAYKANWGRMPAVLARLHDARHRGHVSLRPRVQRSRRLPADLGARGRARSDAAAPERPGAA